MSLDALSNKITISVSERKLEKLQNFLFFFVSLRLIGQAPERPQHPRQNYWTKPRKICAILFNIRRR